MQIFSSAFISFCASLKVFAKSTRERERERERERDYMQLAHISYLHMMSSSILMDVLTKRKIIVKCRSKFYLIKLFIKKEQFTVLHGQVT